MRSCRSVATIEVTVMADDDSGVPNMTVGLIADPEAAPDEIGRHLTAVLPELLSRRSQGPHQWRIDLVRQRLPAGTPGSHDEFVQHAVDLSADRSWAAVLCVTDLPLRADDGHALVADLAVKQRVAVLSLPAFGATRLRRRVADVAVEVVAELTGGKAGDSRGGNDGAPVRGMDERNLPGPFRLVTPGVAGVAQVVASRALFRQLVGMVRSNRPWRLILGLRGAIVAALAFSAFWLINPSVWQLGNAHSMARLTAITLWAVAAIVVWLIVYHHLWERRTDDDDVDRRQVVLFNTSTVLTLLIGVGIAYVGLLLLNFCAGYLVIDDGVLASQTNGSAGFVEHLKLTWMATSGASVAGALGAGFESEESVREAAYSQREAERRRQWKERGRDDRRAPESERDQ